MKNWKKELLTIPNFLSVLRLVMIPLYMHIFLNATTQQDHFLAGSILILSCLTDMADGFIARRFHMQSTVGKVLDPIADKATQFSLTACLCLQHAPLRWLLALFLVKEAFQLAAGIIALGKGQILDGALHTGKICTAVFFVSLILLVIFPGVSEAFVLGLSLANGTLLLASLFSYVLAYLGFGDHIRNLKADK